MFTVMFFSTLIQNLETEPYKDFKYDSFFSVLPEISEFLSTWIQTFTHPLIFHENLFLLSVNSLLVTSRKHYFDTFMMVTAYWSAIFVVNS